MTTPVIDKVMDAADQLREQAVEAEKIGKLTDQTVKIMKSAENTTFPPAYRGALATSTTTSLSSAFGSTA